MKFAGDTKAEWVRVTITDADGTVPLGLDSRSRRAICRKRRVWNRRHLTRCGLREERSAGSRTRRQSFEMVSLGPDNVVAMAMVVDPVEKRDAELSSIVWELLPAVREHVEKEQQIPVSLYRLSIQSADGQPLVEYVVDTAERSVRAWMAEGVKPVWARGVAEPRTSD